MQSPEHLMYGWIILGKAERCWCFNEHAPL